MKKIGIDFPATPRKTALDRVEQWYQELLAERLGRPLEPIKRSNFGQYDMAVHYLTSVLEEAAAVNKVAIFNIDHMAQIQFAGKDAATLLNRVLPADIASMKIGQCKYTLLLNESGGVQDDLIVMKLAEDNFILVINAGHDITGTDHGHTVELVADADLIIRHAKEGEDIQVKDLSDELVKIDVQGPLSFRLLKDLYGKEVLANRRKPEKNMPFFNFNEFRHEGNDYIISRTGYTNRWGWELYIPVVAGETQFRRIVTKALELGGLLVGLGGRDENRISAGNVGLPLMGQEYTPAFTPTNAPLFAAAIDLSKNNFVGREALLNDKTDKRMILFISEGNVVDRGVYLEGKRIGVVASGIISPNVPLEKRLFICSKRKSVNIENGTAGIGLAWLEHNPYNTDAEGKDIIAIDGEAIRIPVEFYREDEDGKQKGKPILGFISADGINPATAPRPLKHIANL
ncbi:MAG: aminomethyltransferase family protein [Candidatus Cloacimonetes bacterium]|nr:aminomethyltransferase family protein [Candidatus Cloacimonadota bacterium]